MRRSLQLLSSLVLGFLLVGCASQTPQVGRVSPDKTIDLTGKWNDSDSKRVSEKMVSSALNQRWLQEWQNNHQRPPRVIIGQFRNKSSEHIDMETWTKDIERQLINSGRVDFVAMSEEREATRAEQRDQEKFSTRQSQSAIAQETGADYMMSGYMNSQIQRAGGQEVRAYQVHMQLIDIETQEKVWIGSKDIKKRVEQSQYSY